MMKRSIRTTVRGKEVSEQQYEEKKYQNNSVRKRSIRTTA